MLYRHADELFPQEPPPAAPAQEVEVDIDELLDMDSDDLRRRHLSVTNSPPSLPRRAHLHLFTYKLTTIL